MKLVIGASGDFCRPMTPDAGSGDLSAHFQDIQSEGFKSLAENQRVSFVRSTGPKGEKAGQIRAI